MMIKLKNILKSLKNSIIQEVPNELYACEICKKKECDNEQWINCENRITHMTRLDDLKNSSEQK
ncbi:MAG: transcription initiation factor IIE alpha subunit [Oleiphilaceae bacterium]|jgi:transcription initiation factor IIE alpha subunit